MTPRQTIELRQSERRERLNELAGIEDLDDDQTAELDKLSGEYRAGEKQLRAAIMAEEANTSAAEDADGEGDASSEDRERAELRAACKIGNFLQARLQGRSLTGAEAELAAEVGLASDAIPLELWDAPTEKRAAEVEHRAVSGAPDTVGLNLDRLRPAIFAPALVPRLGVEMPRVPSGTYATGTITTSTTAGAVAKGAEAPATQGRFTVTSTTPHRVSGRLEIAIEDIAAVGTENFESVLRDNLSMAMSAELDDLALAGDGAGVNPQGFIGRLTDPANPTEVALWADFAALAADQVDGLWALREGDIDLVLGVDAYKLGAKVFRIPGMDNDGTPGDLSGLAYLESRAGSVYTHQRMPAPANDIQAGIAYRRGRSGIRTAVCPVWSELVIDDYYSGSSKGERYLTVHVLVGDVILVQPNAYARFDLKVA